MLCLHFAGNGDKLSMHSVPVKYDTTSHTLEGHIVTRSHLYEDVATLYGSVEVACECPFEVNRHALRILG